MWSERDREIASLTTLPGHIGQCFRDWGSEKGRLVSSPCEWLGMSRPDWAGAWGTYNCRPPVTCHRSVQIWHIPVQKGTKVIAKADVLKLGPQPKGLNKEQEFGYRLEEPVSRKGEVSEEKQHGNSELPLEKVGWTLLKEPVLMCYDIWTSNHWVRDAVWGESTSQRQDNQMGLSEWKVPQRETCRLPANRAEESRGPAYSTSACSLIHTQTSASPANSAFHALCLQKWRANERSLKRMISTLFQM